MSSDTRWAIYIDIEGFGSLYDREDTVLWALGDLMEAIYLIGTNCYPETADRIFAHQTGDGFVVVSDFGSETLEVPVAIAIALLRHVAMRGRFAKATISEGGFAGIMGCYPKRIRDAEDKDGRVFMGSGQMTVFPVMGTALINAVAIAKRSPSGALLTLDESERTRLPPSCVVQSIPDRRLVSIDWVHDPTPLVAELQGKADLRMPTAEAMTREFEKYFKTTEVKEEWKANSNWYLSLGLFPNDL